MVFNRACRLAWCAALFYDDKAGWHHYNDVAQNRHASGCRFNCPLIDLNFTRKNLMKTLIIAATWCALAVPALAADVGVSINIGQPNFYGRIDLGNFPPPRVIYEQAIIVERPRHYVEQQPIYLRVPPGHQKNWSKHCRRYNACGQRVYFVQDTWYRNDYAPRYREQHGERHPRSADGHHDRRDERHDQRHEARHDQRHEPRDDRRERHDERHGERHDGRGGRD
jgi:hypothetical protein